MDFIKRKAKDFTDEHFLGGISSADHILSEAKSVVYDIDKGVDKIRFLNFILEKNNADYTEHLKVCRDKEDCPKNYAYEGVAYYLSQELDRLGAGIDGDTFTEAERNEAESKLDKILKDLNEVKLGQQVIFEELNEMRDLFFLGKKKWYQLFIGKSVDMTASGIVSETISKQMIEEAKRHLPALLGQ